MDDTEPMDAVDSFILEDHGVDYLFPPAKYVPVVDAKVYDLDNKLGDILLLAQELFEGTIAVVVRDREIRTWCK